MGTMVSNTSRPVITLIAVIAMIAVIIISTVLYAYSNMLSPATKTIVTTSIITKTMTRTKTIITTLYNTLTVYETIVITKTISSTSREWNQTTILNSSTSTLSPSTVVTTSTATTPKTSRVPTANRTGLEYIVSDMVEILAWRQHGLIDRVERAKIFTVSKNTSIFDVANNLLDYTKNSIKEISIGGSESINTSFNQDVGILITLFRGTPCTQYNVEIVDGDPGDDGIVRVRITRYYTSDVCVQVVPKDNLYVALIVVRNPGLQHFKLYIEYNDGTRTSIIELDVFSS